MNVTFLHKYTDIEHYTQIQKAAWWYVLWLFTTKYNPKLFCLGKDFYSTAFLQQREQSYWDRSPGNTIINTEKGTEGSYSSPYNTQCQFVNFWGLLYHVSLTLIYYHVYHGCVVVWLMTLRRGFGLDTGFIHYGDLQLHRLQLQWTLSTLSSLDPTDGTALRWRLTSRAVFDDWSLLTPATNWPHCCVLPSPYNIGLFQWKHSTTVARQPCNATMRSGERIHVTIRPRLLGNNATRHTSHVTIFI
jgi:hypothetical protein